MLIKIPHTLKIILPIIGWVGLCSFFAGVLIITTAQFDTPNALPFFSFFVLAILTLTALFVLLRMGDMGLGSKETNIINKNIKSGSLEKDLSLEEIKETFYHLVHFCRTNFLSIIWGGLIITVIVGIAMRIFTNICPSDILIIFSGGTVATVLSAVFASFYSEQANFSIIKIIRKKIVEAEGEVPDINFDSIASKFYFLFVFPIVTTIIVLICVFPFSVNIAFLSISGIVMVLIIDRILFAYISKSFFEAEEFIKGISQGDKKIFATGSVDKEFIDLINALNKTGKESLILKKQFEETKKEMESRMEELEKFFDLTVNREIKMVEMKKKLQSLKEKQKTKKILKKKDF
ncbi:MAG: hypothetical protein WC534_03220 [Candidatus Paceibacterota bacterium]